MLLEWSGAQFWRTTDRFVTDIWQQSPLLVRGLFGADDLDALCPLAPDDVLALACEAGATSRVMRESGGAWELRHGPFDDAELDALPDGGWTVLVQQVDQLEPPVEALRSRFVDFLPRWRLDDVMVSYAPPGGGVGAHVDNYDVFLVQGRGARRWEVEGAPRAAAAEALVPGQPVRVLERFEAAASELLAPGDALYLPPRWAHRGTSEHAECMTYSVGFRAPSRAELVRHFADTVAARLPEDDRFSDPPEADGALAAGGRVGPAAVDRARAMLRETLEEVLADDDAVAAWAAQALTAPPSPPPPVAAALDGAAYAGEDDEGAEALVRSIADGDDDAPALRHAADAVLAYVNLPGGGVALVADGARVAVADDAAAFVPLLCDNAALPPALLAAPLRESAGLRALVAALVRQGCLDVDLELDL